MQKELTMTVAQFFILERAHKELAWSVPHKIHGYIADNKTLADSSKDLNMEMPKLILGTDAFEDIVDLIQGYIYTFEDGKEKDDAEEFLSKLADVEEEPETETAGEEIADEKPVDEKPVDETPGCNTCSCGG